LRIGLGDCGFGIQCGLLNPQSTFTNQSTIVTQQSTTKSASHNLNPQSPTGRSALPNPHSAID